MLYSLPLFVAVMLANAASPSDTVRSEALDGITVSASIANTRTSSLRLVNIDRQKIQSNASGRTFPELIRNVPGVYSSSETGSFGDAKINIRGFKQENISVLLNGIPISGLSSGNMFWNNWTGLSEATAKIQVQKGIGNSMLSDNSVGGTINIITTSPAPESSAEAGYTRTSYGTNSASFSINSGALKNGWVFSLMGSHNWGSSYVDCTNLHTWSYYAVIKKRINGHQSITLTALGSPERHQQRSSRLSYREVEKYGRNYNKNWGWDIDENGNLSARTLSQNNFFKPYFTLTHSLDKGEGIKFINSAYLALASGGGYYSESTGKRIATFLSSEGQIDWAAVRNYNKTTYSDEHGTRAQNIMSDYLAGHTQAGIKSNVMAVLNERLQFDAGLHYQLHDTWEKERISDLLGADYWYEDYTSKSLAGTNGRNPIKKVGDFVRTDNGRTQHYLTLYGLGKFTMGKMRNTILTLGISLSGTSLRRWDAYNYPAEAMISEWVSRTGSSIKAGALRNIDASNSLYANAAVYSRVPYANVFFSNGNNTPSKNITNEKNYIGEMGYRKTGNRFTVEATAYCAVWQDKALTSAAYKSLDEEPHKFMVKGLNALHLGFEINSSYRMSSMLRLEAYASLGEWKWLNDVDATIYNPETMQPIQQVQIYSKGLHVGDAPQTQIGGIINITLPKGFSGHIDWNYNDRIWADFEPVTRTDTTFREDSYRIPVYHLLNAGASWRGNAGKMELTLFINIDNITDSHYIERSKDGYAHDKASFTGYWGNGRNFNFGIRLSI